MGVLLFCLAIAMIVGGSASVYSGWLIVANERGWSMVIGGSVCASAGAIVLGLSVLAGRLRRISHQTEVLGETMSRIEMATWGPPPPLIADDVEEVRTVAGEPEPIEQAAYRPDLDIDPVALSPEPDVVPPSLPVVEALPSVISASELAGSNRPADPTLVAGSAPAEPTVVGSYSAGENAYLMYSDGSIQADTPEGRFRFDSLDDLKTYVAEGERKARASRSNETSRPAEHLAPDPQPHTSPEMAEIAKA